MRWSTGSLLVSIALAQLGGACAPRLAETAAVHSDAAADSGHGDAHGVPGTAAGSHEHGRGHAAGPETSGGPVHPGTAAMVGRLAQMNASLSFEDDIWGGVRRAAEMAAQPAPSDPHAALVRLFQLGMEQLNAGEPRTAADSFGAMRDILRTSTSLTDSHDLREVTSMLAISWLRFGEIENCAANHNADSCLLPLKDGGIHLDPEGAGRAITELEALLRAQPDNLRDRWVLNIAHMARGTWPDGLRPEWRIEPVAFASDESFPRFFDVAPALGLDVADQAGGTIVDDFTGDGNLDIVSSSYGRNDQVRFFASRGDGTFEDRTAAAGLTGLVGGLNVVQADYDGDGWLDFLILRGGWTDIPTPYPNSLVRNRGDGTFEDVTERAGLLSFHPTQTGAWADYDNDGDLDLFIGNETVPNSRIHPSELFRNEGDGTFVEVGAESGVAASGFSKSAVWGDYDNDGLVDLFVSRHAQPNVLFHNDGPDPNGTWRFSERAVEAGVVEPIHSFPAFWWDYDNDGWLDLLVNGYGGPVPDAATAVISDVLGLQTPAARVHLYRNNRDGTFDNVAAEANVDDVLYTMGTNFGDLDNDGWEDWYAGTGNPDYRSLFPNRMYRNAGDGTFRDVTTNGGFGHLQKGHGVSFADIDNDGDQDIFHDLGGAFDGDWFPNVLFENPGSDNRWVALRLRGAGANPSAIGSRVAIHVIGAEGPRILHREVGPGGSFGANSLQVEVGLADASAIERIVVRWPGRLDEEVFTGAAPGAFWSLEAGSGTARRLEQPAFRLGGG